MTCRDCLHYLSSDEANKPRSGLAGYGYCKAAPSIELRARFFHETSACWLSPIQFKERRHV
ncbi:MAG: hypothetical protein ACK4FP_04950 [Azonexus sp.]